MLKNTMTSPATLRRREALRLLGATSGFIALRGGLAASPLLAFAAPSIPRGSVIRTVLKDISPDALRGGATLMHEHVLAMGMGYRSPPTHPLTTYTEGKGRGEKAFGPARDASGKPLEPGQEDIDLLVDELVASKRDGLTGIVDASIGPRRPQAIEDLKTLATRSGVHIILAGAYYKAPYPKEVIERSETDIAEGLVRDAGAQRWGAFGEIGSSVTTHPDERKMMRAVAKAHLQTGLPIFTHTPHESCESCALEQLDVFTSQGVDPRHLCIGHVSDFLDDPKALTVIEIAKRGAFIGFDTVGHQFEIFGRAPVTDRMHVQRVLAVLEAGYEDQLLLSSDLAPSFGQQLKANWGEGFSAVLTTFAGKLRHAGVSEKTLRKILRDNPRRFLAFVPKA